MGAKKNLGNAWFVAWRFRARGMANVFVDVASRRQHGGAARWGDASQVATRHSTGAVLICSELGGAWPFADGSPANEHAVGRLDALILLTSIAAI